MDGNIYKLLTVLFLVAEQTLTSFIAPPRHPKQLTIPKVVPTVIEQQISGENYGQEKVSAYNIKSGKTIKSVSTNAVEHSESLFSCGSPDAHCTEEKIQPKADVRIPKREPTAILPEPTGYIISPVPTVTPMPSVAPEPTEPFPIDPPPCPPLPCRPGVDGGTNIVCPDKQQMVVMPCID